MSKRHRPDPEAQPPRIEVRAHARGERHRINSELQRVTNEVCGGLEPDDAVEPGASWKPIHHHDAERAKVAPRRVRHWKLKMWKRRSAARKAKAQAIRLAVDET
jgi:hypothetical protein